MTNKSSFRYSGLVQRKTVGIEPSSDKKGFVLVTRKPKLQVKSTIAVEIV